LSQQKHNSSLNPTHPSRGPGHPLTPSPTFVSHHKDKDKYRTGAKMGSGVFWSVQKLAFFEEDAEMVDTCHLRAYKEAKHIFNKNILCFQGDNCIKLIYLLFYNLKNKTICWFILI